MYVPTNNYLTASQKLSRTPKSKIIIDSVEYSGMDVIKTHPKIKIEALKMIGEFPTKECKITLFNRDEHNPINVLEKDIQVFRGLVLENDTVEFIPQGTFNPKSNDIKSNSTDKTIEISMKDKSVVFDVNYGGVMEYPTTLGEFINEIVTRHGLVLETSDFPFHDMVLNERPNFNLETTSERQLIAQAAELGGCIAQMSRNNKVRISKPYSTQTAINRINYKKLSSKEKQFGPINSVVLGKKDINDDIVWQDVESIEQYGLFEWRIEDNPYVDLNRAEWINKIAEKIAYMTMIPFELNDSIDNYLYDLNDSITVEDKFGNLFNTTILSIESTSRIFSNFKASIQNDPTTNYNLAGSTKKDISRIKFDIDHINNDLKIVANKVNNLGEQTARITLDVNGIKNQVTEVNNNLKDVNNELDNTKKNLQEQITENETRISQTASEITSVIQKTGGNNKIKNSVGFKGTEFWELSKDAEVITSQDSDTERTTNSGSKFILKAGFMLNRYITIVGNLYTISFKYKKINISSANAINIELHRSENDFDVIYSGIDEKKEWTEIVYKYRATVNNPYIVFNCGGDRLEFSDFIVNDLEQQPWSQYFDEVYGKTHQLDGTGLALSNLSNDDNSKLDDNNLVFFNGSTVNAEISKERVLSNTGEFKTQYKVGNLITLTIDENNVIEY